MESIVFFLQLDLNEGYPLLKFLLAMFMLKECDAAAASTPKPGTAATHWPINNLMQIIIEYAVCV